MALRNLRRNLHMFLDILEPKIGNKNASLDKTVLVILSQIFERVAQFGLKCTLQKKVAKVKLLLYSGVSSQYIMDLLKL